MPVIHHTSVDTTVFDLDDARLYKALPECNDDAGVFAATETFGHEQSIRSVKDGIVGAVDCRVGISFGQIVYPSNAH